MDSFVTRGSLKATELRLHAGSLAAYEGRSVQIIEVLSLERALVTDLASGELIRAPITDLKPPQRAVEGKTDSLPLPRDYADYGDKEWVEINRRFDIIYPLLCLKARSRADVEEIAEGSDLSVASIYQMIKRYESTRSKASLLPRKRGRKRGASLLDPRVEALIAEGIREHYLTDQKKNASAAYRFIKTRCTTLKLDVPSEGAVRLRIGRIEPAKSRKARLSPSEAKQELDQVKTGIPTAERPLDFVQIDHTRVDLIVVDERDRLPLGRPWVTVAIDVKTRCIIGIYFSLDAPSYVSVGSVIANMLLPKSQYLAELDVAAEWPMWGPPQKIGADNGADFRSNYLKELPEDYPFAIEWRPLGGTHYGGHIERLLGTFALWMKELPGATFSNPLEKGDYDSQESSALTLNELERYVVRHLCEGYHKEQHRGLPGRSSPYREWERGILGTPSQAGIGAPVIYSDPDRVKVDLLPYVKRIITRQGITHLNIPYQNAEVFGPARLALTGKERSQRPRLFRWDPRDITRIWMWDATAGGYHTIPVDVPNMPAMSLSEYKAHEKALAARDLPHDAYAIAHHAEQNYALIDESKEKTKRERKAREKRIQNARKSVAANLDHVALREPARELSANGTFDDGEIVAYDDAEEW